MKKNPIQFLNEGDNPRLAELLGMGPKGIQVVNQCKSPQEAQAVFKGLQERVPKLFKEMALSMHPDRCPNDPDATKKFAALSAVKDVLLELRMQIRQPRPQPVRQVIVVNQGFSGGFTVNSTTSTTTTGGFGGFGRW